mmetsp:Transcript_12494/g.18340  ORF Transcript_12494/g.18340 Transcript_12494/m.18340 type:complete len:300 (-) Transcript_12494:37-936(-)
MTDASRQEEELDALKAFYGEDFIVEDDLEPSTPWRIRLGKIILELHIVSDYPSVNPPIPKIQAPPWVLDERRRKDLESELIGMFVTDSEVAILWAEHCRSELENYTSEHEQQVQPEQASIVEESKTEIDSEHDPTVRTFVPPTSKYGQPIRTFDDSVIGNDLNKRHIFRGNPFHPPKSGSGETFIGHTASVRTMDHVNWVLAELLFNDKKVARATHNMIAYRFWDEDRACVVADNDDDGEKGAGMKLAALLELSKTQNCIVVVSRWFGGVKLGPARFKYIANAGREALIAGGYLGNNNC